MAPGCYDYVAGGADDEVTLRDNVAAWTRLRLRPRVLHDVSAVDVSTTVLGRRLELPVLAAPVAFQRIAHPDGEAATAAGVGRAGTIMVVSTRSSVRLEDIRASAPGCHLWFQVYVMQDRGWTVELVDRAVAVGAEALVVTVDTPLLGRRRRDEANRFVLPDGVSMANLPDGLASGSAGQSDDGRFEQTRALVPEDLGWLADRSGLPVVAKGLLRGDDAVRCLDAGAAAVAVSNHGGRQLDGVVATADALAEVVDAVAGSGEVYADGGIRRGTDVLKALCLGARAVMVGRPQVWGLAAGGAGGVEAVLSSLGRQLSVAMALAGAPSLADLDRSMVVAGSAGP